MLKNKVEDLLTIAARVTPEKVSQPDTNRANHLVAAMKELDSAVLDVEKEVSKVKKSLSRELSQHKRLLNKIFSVLNETDTTAKKQYSKLGYKDWMVRWWMLWREEQWEECTWEDETLRTSAKCYNKEVWEKKRSLLIKAGILTEDSEGDLTVNKVPQNIIAMEKEV